MPWHCHPIAAHAVLHPIPAKLTSQGQFSPYNIAYTACQQCPADTPSTTSLHPMHASPPPLPLQRCAATHQLSCAEPHAAGRKAALSVPLPAFQLGSVAPHHLPRRSHCVPEWPSWATRRYEAQPSLPQPLAGGTPKPLRRPLPQARPCLPCARGVTTCQASPPPPPRLGTAPS